MTDDGRFLSRRERRAQEEREATSVPADTDALAVGPISESIPTHTADGRPLSRRERRRLERARQPMETWTAEEEMIATGQIPAMTPERIAEQEKLARERAAAAQREADQASAELEGILGNPAIAPSAPAAPTESREPWAPSAATYEYTPSVQSAPATPPVDPQPSDDPVSEWQGDVAPAPVQDATPAWEPVVPHDPEPTDDSQPPARSSLIAAVAADVAPTAPPEPEPTSDDASGSDHAVPPAPQVPWAPAANELAELSELNEAPEITGVPNDVAPVDQELDEQTAGDALLAEQAPQEPAAPAPGVEEPAAPTPAAPPVIPGMPPGMSPEMFAELFPPGSLQRRMMEDQAAAEAATTAEPEDPAAEIRRLTQEAVAGLDAASSRVAEQSASAAQPRTEPSAEPSSASESATEAPAVTAPDSGPPTFSIPTFGSQEQAQREPASPASHDTVPVSPSPTAPSPVSPSPTVRSAAPLEQAPFDAILGDHPETAALDQVSTASAEFNAPPFGDVSPNSAPPAEPTPHDPHGFAPAPGPSSPWGEHPLSQVDREAPELPEMPPAQGVPHPDLSSVGFRGPTADRGPVPIVEPVPTGQIEVPPRERPELTGADVPRHFKWAHLAVFGAVALLLGVVVWHVL